MTKHDNAGTLPATLKFQDTDLSIIDRDGVPWLASTDLAVALGCSKPGQIANLYNRNKSEFLPGMSDIIVLMKSGNLTSRVRVFNARGCYLIAMLAKTDRAKAFRRWVLDVLEAQAAPAVAAAPDLTALRQQVVGDVVGLIMDKIGAQIAAIPPRQSPPRTMPPLTKPDDPMPRLMDGHAVFRIGAQMVIVDTRDYALKRGDRAVVIRVEDGEFPQIVTVLDQPPVKGWFDRCMVFSSGVPWYIPVGAVLGRVVWEGFCGE
tara:strand:- start:670 stop:1452 length:783 start_codon:yes stop_codon:yes gene_type:complete